jgi:type II restriction enzyme
VGRIVVDENVQIVLEKEEKKREKLIQKRHQDVQIEIEEEHTHIKIQYLLMKIGKSLGYDVLVASNDRAKSYNNESFSFISLHELPEIEAGEDIKKTIALIDVIWFEKGTNKFVSAYEVEKSTSIYSGVLRLTDLALTLPNSEKLSLYLVAPDQREKEIIAQLKRPSLIKQDGLKIAYILFSELCTHCESICKLGEDHTIMDKVAKGIK